MYIAQTDSTNRLMYQWLSQDEGFYIATDYQTQGRGQFGNSWESERGQNLLVSFLLHPHLPMRNQFRLAMITGLAVVETLGTHFHSHFHFKIKWPNDIYYKDKKLGGILIENQISQGYVKDCIIGLGLNINQQTFVSDAPNPVSLRQITGTVADRDQLLQAIREHLLALTSLLDDEHEAELQQRYIANLYRREGLHEYEDANGRFKAEWIGIGKAGEWLVRTEQGEERTYLLKQIKFIIHNS
ncbi:MAG: biotin--[acetyl-CoA-carboxylase] ligase [Paludibacteraceae bacterium]|nr:biotin--[acetyl-CoA-carboxylase] ligase [Paludibacteraceae bacterium]